MYAISVKLSLQASNVAVNNLCVTQISSSQFMQALERYANYIPAVFTSTYNSLSARAGAEAPDQLRKWPYFYIAMSTNECNYFQRWGQKIICHHWCFTVNLCGVADISVLSHEIRFSPSVHSDYLNSLNTLKYDTTSKRRVWNLAEQIFFWSKIPLFYE